MRSNGKQTVSAENRPEDHVDGDHQTYLRVAETVLAGALTPLKAREIVERGIERGLFGDHVLSRTPEKSMQARLSMDILNRKEQSKFIRSDRGRFTLRSKFFEHPENSVDADSHGARVYEYVAQRRVLQTPKEEVLCTPEKAFDDVLTFQGIDTDTGQILRQLLKENGTLYVPRSEAETRNDAKQFVTYVLVQCGQRLLYFKRSYLSRAAEFLRGSKCIGFGGHVSAADADILSLRDLGLAACARRELAEELHLPEIGADDSSADKKQADYFPSRITNLATRRLFNDVSLEQLGVLNDDSSEVGRRHVAVIYRAWLPDWNSVRRLQKGDSSIKGLGWIDLSKDKLDISDFEYWSQLCLRKFYPSTVVAKPASKILNNARVTTDRVIVVAGRIGSGKTETADYLSQKLGCPLINTGALMRELMNISPDAEIDRRDFQARAYAYICAEGGPQRLAALISARVKALGAERCVVDGVRHLATYESLVSLLGETVSLVFVQTPPDVAYEMYRVREVQGTLTFSYRDFLEIYDAPVESEITSLGRKAHAYVYNSFGMEAFRRTLDELVMRLSTVSEANDSVTTPGIRRGRFSDDAA